MIDGWLLLECVHVLMLYPMYALNFICCMLSCRDMIEKGKMFKNYSKCMVAVMRDVEVR